MAPPERRSTSPVKSIATASSSLGVRERIALFEDRGVSPAPALSQGIRPGSPRGFHALGLGLHLTRSPAPSSMLSTPFSPAQSMPPMSPSVSGARYDEPRSISYHSSASSTSSRDRPASPVKSVKSYQSSEGEHLLVLIHSQSLTPFL